MSEDWQNDPATEMQKEKLRFFSCTWHEGITREQASKVLSQCVEKFPEKESEWQSRPATQGQLRQLKEHGIEAEPGMTYRKANGLRACLKTSHGLAKRASISRIMAR
jgi:hypothetical protein